MSTYFRAICLLHSCIDVVSGSLMMFFLKDVVTVGFGKDVASKILGSTPHDQLIIKTSQALAGICYLFMGIMLFMVAFVKDKEFHGFFAKGSVLIHLLMAAWRLTFERKVKDAVWDWPWQVIWDVALTTSWVVVIIKCRREKQD